MGYLTTGAAAALEARADREEVGSEAWGFPMVDRQPEPETAVATAASREPASASASASVLASVPRPSLPPQP